jgi:Fe-S-cluster-containing hydrogenase component 2
MPLAPQRADVPVTIDESKCIDGCTLCVDMCSLDSLAIDDSSGKAYMHVDECGTAARARPAVPPEP